MKEYTVKDAMDVLGLQPKRISSLFKEIGVTKRKNRYYATQEEIDRLLQRKNQTIKMFMLASEVGGDAF